VLLKILCCYLYIGYVKFFVYYRLFHNDIEQNYSYDPIYSSVLAALLDSGMNLCGEGYRPDYEDLICNIRAL
jgi:hypothetical protein